MSDPDPSVWMGGDGILRVRYPQNCHLTLELMEKVHQLRLALCRERCALLVYAESVASAEYEAQQFASREDVAPLVDAMAIIVKSVFTRAMAELFMRFHKPPYPTRIFTDERAALEWLRQYVPEGPLTPDSGDTV
jgi:hypothetical protein